MWYLRGRVSRKYLHFRNCTRLIVIILLLSILNLCFGDPLKNGEGKQKMKPTENVEYSVLYANVQHNSFENVKIQSSGKLVTKHVFKEDIDEVLGDPVTLHVKGTIIGIQVNPYFLIYENGIFKKEHLSIYRTTGLGAFYKNYYYVFRDSRDDVFFDYQNKIIRTDLPVLCYKDWYISIMMPFGKGILTGIQYTGGVERKPRKFGFGFTKYGKNIEMSEWSFGDVGQITSAHLTSVLDTLVVVYKNKVITIDPQNGKKNVPFLIEGYTIINTSLDLENNLVIHAQDKLGKTVVLSYTLDGKKIWEYSTEDKIENKQPPVCGEDSVVYFIINDHLVCLQDGNELWRKEVSSCVNPLLTNTQNNRVVVQAGNHINVFNSDGICEFTTLISEDLKESFTAPPVVGGDGKIYVASEIGLYSFE